MHINWLGQTCIKLQTKNIDEDVVVLIDAYRPQSGDFPRSFSPQIALFSNGMNEAATLSQDPFIMDTLGECEVKNVMITAWPMSSGTIVYKINAENLSIVHLGRMTKKVDIAELEKIGLIDVLIIPVGGGDSGLSPEDAASITTALEPRVVIPVGYQCDTDKSAKPVSDFIKELGVKPAVTDKKVILKKKDLPQEEMQLMVLEKS